MMKKIRMNCTAPLDETFADFLLSRRAKGLAEKTLESYSSQWKAVARHLDTGTDIAALQKADLDAMIVSMRNAGLSPNSINSYTRVLKSFFSWCNEQGLTRLNIPLYKTEETVKETYSDAELTALLTELLYAFPMREMRVFLPAWVQALECDNPRWPSFSISKPVRSPSVR